VGHLDDIHNPVTEVLDLLDPHPYSARPPNQSSKNRRVAA
jgi:hypothetical protein